MKLAWATKLTWRLGWIGCLLLVAPAHAKAGEALPDGFIRLREIAPGIRQDIRYASAFNFTGAAVAGYGRADCVLTQAAGQALIRVEARLGTSGYALKLFDCYRPARAVRAFLAWTQDGKASDLGRIFHPDIAKDMLVARGFIASVSSHSRGSTVDVGLVSRFEPALPTPTGGSRCDGPLQQRPQETSLDLGTSFDCFSAKSAGRDPSVGPDALRHRRILRDAMKAEGFRGYGREWWHFTLANEPFPKTIFDFAIE
jgi:D-alanyl-D-alanine dipeptidase